MSKDENHQKPNSKEPIKAINAISWGVYTTLAWIQFRDFKIVDKVHTSYYRSGGDTEEVQATMLEYINEEDVSHIIQILTRNLFVDKIDCNALLRLGGNRTKVPQHQWMDLFFCFPFVDLITLQGKPRIVARHKHSDNDATDWCDPLFQVSQVMEVFPEFEAQQSNKFQQMEDLQWSETAITLLDDAESVRVAAREYREVFNYAAMGFNEGRATTPKPDQKWALIKIILTNSGELDFRHPKGNQQTNIKQYLSVVRGRLKAFMGIDNDPIPYYYKIRKYISAFQAASTISDVESPRWDNTKDHASDYDNDDPNLEEFISNQHKP